MMAIWGAILLAEFTFFRLIYGLGDTPKIELKEPIASIVIYSCVILLFICLFMIAEVNQPRIDAAWLYPLRIIGVVLTIFSILFLLLTTASLLRSTGINQLKPQDLVIKGPYALVRHPLYSGIVTLALGWYLVRNAAYALSVLPLLFILFYRQAIYEEKEILEPKFESQYKAYKEKVPRMYRIPHAILLLVIYIIAIVGWLN